MSEQLPAEIRSSNRLLTAAEFHRLADVPPEVEWFTNISNAHTRRAYEKAVRDFMGSLFEYLCERNAVTHNPVKGVERPKTESGEGKTPALGDHQARKLLRARGRGDQEQARSRDPVHPAVSRAAARGAV